METINCRFWGREPRISDEPLFHRYKNFSSQTVDGQFSLVEVEPVFPSLASEHSITMNALTQRERKPLSQRLNVDAVDLFDDIKKLS